MKGILKFVLYMGVLLLFIIGSSWMIFSFDEMRGMLVGALLWCIPFGLFVVSLIALAMGKLPKVGIRSRGSATVVLLTSILAGASLILLVISNVFVIQAGNTGATALEKIAWYGKLTGQMPMQSDAFKVEGKYATYYVTKDNEEKVAVMEEMFPRVEAQLNRFLPPVTSGEKPEIELHQSDSTLNLLQMEPEMSGVYNVLTGKINLNANQLGWEELVIHEYTHYRVHQFQLQEVGEHRSIPHWLEEGFAQMMMGTLPLGPFDHYKEFTLQDATSKIANMNNPMQDVYTYGQIITLEISKEASKEQFQAWLLTEDNAVIEQEIRDLYAIPETHLTHQFLLDKYEATLAKDPEYFDRLLKVTADGWEDEWDSYKKDMYFPMYKEYLPILQNVVIVELEWDKGEQILNEWIQYDPILSQEEIQQEQAYLVAGRGELEEAISLMEVALNKQEHFERSETMNYYLSIYKLLLEDPFHPEALSKLEERTIYSSGTQKWLQQIQAESSSQ